MAVENLVQFMKGTKEWNPLWDSVVPEWAYFKAPRLKDHMFTPYNHNWTAGPLYWNRFAPVEVPACWAGDCKTCIVDCSLAALYPQQGKIYDSVTHERVVE